jgi:hypothetical protein
MAQLTLQERDLASRANALHRVFAALRGDRDRVGGGFAIDSPGGTKAIVMSDRPRGTLKYRDESFRTFSQRLRCRYFELWALTSSGTYVLDRAYFTLFEVVPGVTAYKDVLCIHADPADADEHKQGPHLHVVCAPEPIPGCHFPLDLGALKAVLKDCGSLTEAMQRAVGVVAKDVLPRF